MRRLRHRLPPAELMGVLIALLLVFGGIGGALWYDARQPDHYSDLMTHEEYMASDCELLEHVKSLDRYYVECEETW